MGFSELVQACKFYPPPPPCFNEVNFHLEPVVKDEGEWRVGHVLLPGNNLSATWKKGEIDRLVEVTAPDLFRACGLRRALEFVATNGLNERYILPVVYSFDGKPLLVSFGPEYTSATTRRSVDLLSPNELIPDYYCWLVLRKKRQ